jgi:hypothetical protein
MSIPTSKHGQNISYMDAEIIGSYFEGTLQTLQRLVSPLWSISPRHLCHFLAQKQDPFISALA